ncbi:unconventional myosin-XIX-like [Mya arenaria]|uniref:unconventional myosin-XIX-like n=1 Tax=Mya arenaria TaxID=6604 RepID=UPI0022E12678|nr:unconventional myosin-XIX-like [Mya arenaria]
MVDKKSAVVPGVRVYVQDKHHVWRLATVTKTNTILCTVIVTGTNEEREVKCDSVLPGSDQDLLCVEGLTQLTPINQASVLSCLHARFSGVQFYTGAGSTVVAVNPFQDVPHMYTEDRIHAYCQQGEDSPHVYRTAGEAYRRVSQGLGKVDQCIIVSGESGSGKTVSAKHLLRYLTSVSNPLSSDDSNSSLSSIEQRILDSNPVLEAFGNAATQRNNNSSRFGKYIQLHFNRCGVMQGAEIHTYLLEKTRVVHQSPGESNFHIFYQIMNSLERGGEGQQQEPLRGVRRDTFRTLPHGVPGHTHHDLEDTLHAMTDMGLSKQLQQHVISLLVAILYVGNIVISPIEEDLCELLSDKVSQEAVEHSARLLGVDQPCLTHVLLYRNIQSGGPSRRSVFIKPIPEREANSRRDCLATLLYSRLFEWLVGFINRQIKPETFDHTLGILDIYGFEAFERNSLEQLCINYANERLQQHYVSIFLRDLQLDYEGEGIQWQPLAYVDNKPCLQALHGPSSVFSVLNEDVQLNRQTDTRLLSERLLSLSKSTVCVKKPRSHLRDPAFTVEHYAGDVTYTVEQLSAKNRDNIPQELVSLLASSTNEFVSGLFTDFTVDEGSGRRKKTVLGKFKAAMDSLMSSLDASDVHYIRCIKPNRESVAGRFDRQFVHFQLLAAGIIETVKISSLGFPVRMTYISFLHRYGLILRNSPAPKKPLGSTPLSFDSPATSKQNKASTDSPSTPRRKSRRRAGVTFVDHTRRCCVAVMEMLFVDGCHIGQFGNTKIFMHQHQVDRLEKTRYDILFNKASLIQRVWRHHVMSNRLVAIRRNMAARLIQKAWRKYLHRHRINAIMIVQKCIRMHCARLKFMKLRKEKAKKDRKVKKATWKPIMDRKRTSPGSRRSRKKGELSGGSTGQSDISSGLSSDDGSLMQSLTSDGSLENYSEDQMDIRGKENYNSMKFTTSTPSGQSQLLEQNIAHINMEEVRKCTGKKLLPNGRPNFRSSPVRKYKLRNRNVNKQEKHSVGAGGCSPLKKRKTNLGSLGTKEALNVGDGIVTRRKLPSGPVRFHTRESVLKHAHRVHQRELPKGLQDCLATPTKPTRYM